VVHINAGIGLVGAIDRQAHRYGKEAMARKACR
jgi:hypothetical protein